MLKKVWQEEKIEEQRKKQRRKTNRYFSFHSIEIKISIIHYYCKTYIKLIECIVKKFTGHVAEKMNHDMNVINRIDSKSKPQTQ